MKRLIIGLLLVLVSSSFNLAYAFKCGRYLIEVGDSKVKVMQACGEPESMATHMERKGIRQYANISEYNANSAAGVGQDYYLEVDIVVDDWIYNFGRSRFQQALRFENGVLQHIEELSLGR